MSAIAQSKPIVHYPDCDGEPMSDNTLQFRWIATLHGNLEAQFRDSPNVFVAGDHLIYAVEGDNAIRQAPDVYVAFGPAKGDRGSYKVWEEGGTFPQVIFEVWSPGNRYEKMEKKKDFYEEYGAEEYYIIYPSDRAGVAGWLRQDERLVPVPEMNAFVSPLLGVRFEVDEEDVAVYGPSGRRFLSPAEIEQERELAERQVESEKRRAESEKRRAESEKRRAESEKLRSEKLAAKLRELGVDPESV